MYEEQYDTRPVYKLRNLMAGLAGIERTPVEVIAALMDDAAGDREIAIAMAEELVTSRRAFSSFIKTFANGSR